MKKALIEKKNRTQKCSHPSFYTIDDDISCNECHKYLGYFDSKLGLFVKKTKNTIADEYLNKRLTHSIGE